MLAKVVIIASFVMAAGAFVGAPGPAAIPRANGSLMAVGKDDEVSTGFSHTSRRHIFQRIVASATAATGLLLVAPPPARPKSYSQNARNLERLNQGDASAGSVYDNNPSTPNARKRRGMQGCKNPVAREEAAAILLRDSSAKNPPSLSEKECNQRVLEENSDFMLKALQNLDCPACPYGIAAERAR